VSEERRPVYYRTLARENRRLREMVENLLDFARMEAGRHTYRMEPVAVTELVREVVESARDRVQDDGRVIELTLPAEECLVAGDREALARAVGNLLDNAVKYSPASTPVEVAVSAADGLVTVSVADSGPGIPKSEHGRIFRKFLRGSSARALNVKGTGIGLAMVRHIIDGHGGRTVVDSEPGRGSRFVIALPAAGAGGQPEAS
jgi:two-component system phosphate regulon sensor histidine kinase PhoR